MPAEGPLFVAQPLLAVLPHQSRVTVLSLSLPHYILTSLLLHDRASFRPYHAPALWPASAPPSSHRRRRQNSRPRFPSRHRARVFQSDYCTLQKSSVHRLSQICSRPPGQTISRARIQDVLQRPPSHQVSPQSLCATHLAKQSAFHNRASVRPPRATRRRISLLPLRSSHFFPPASHTRNFRKTPHPSKRDRHFFAARRRSHLLKLPGKESTLQDRPCRRKWPSGCTSSSQCGSGCLSLRDSHSQALRPSPSSRCPRRRYVLPCWGRENPRDSRSRRPHDEAPLPAPGCRRHPQALDDKQAAIHPSARSKRDPAAAAFSCVKCAPANSSGPRGA